MAAQTRSESRVLTICMLYMHDFQIQIRSDKLKCIVSDTVVDKRNPCLRERQTGLRSKARKASHYEVGREKDPRKGRTIAACLSF